MDFIAFADLCQQGKIHNQRVLIRADLNVPQDEAGHITEDTRIQASLPCIEMALKAGAAVMVTSHLGRPKEGQWTQKDSLEPIAKRLSDLLGRPVPLLQNWISGVSVKAGGGDAGELPLQRGRENQRSSFVSANGRIV